MEFGDFEGFNFCGNSSYEILQFADNTLLIVEGRWRNLWCIKSIQRGFKLVSSLGVNFIKSKLYGINLSTHFLQEDSFFLC